MLEHTSTLFSLVKATTHKHNHKHKKNELVGFFVLMLTPMLTQFSLAYTCACAYAYVYAYALVKTRLKISNFRLNTTVGG